MKPVLFVTGHAPPDRVGAFAALHERETIEVALYGGRSLHGPSAPGTLDEAAGPSTGGRARGAAVSASLRAPARDGPSGGQRPLPRGRVLHRRTRRAALHLGGRAPRGRAADPVGIAVGASAQRAAHAQLSRAAPAVSLGRRGRDVRTARQRLRAGAGRAQRARRAAVGRQRVLERPRQRASDRSRVARRGDG